MNIGETYTCAETGKQFVFTPQGCSFNGCMSSSGETLSDEGAYIREQRRVREDNIAYGYLSNGGKAITTWKGGNLMKVTSMTRSKRGAFGHGLTYVKAVSPDGREWYGKGCGESMLITMRVRKGARL